jgi:nucleoside-diphosphate-sugar epimerase
VAFAIAELRRGRPVLLAHPDRIRDFVHVDDVAQCVRFAVEHPPIGLRESEVGTGTGTSLGDAAREIARALNRPEDLVGATLARPTDVNPVTVATTPHGSFGLCTTDFAEGIHRTLQEA